MRAWQWLHWWPSGMDPVFLPWGCGVKSRSINRFCPGKGKNCEETSISYVEPRIQRQDASGALNPFTTRFFRHRDHYIFKLISDLEPVTWNSSNTVFHIKWWHQFLDFDTYIYCFIKSCACFWSFDFSLAGNLTQSALIWSWNSLRFFPRQISFLDCMKRKYEDIGFFGLPSSLYSWKLSSTLFFYSLWYNCILNSVFIWLGVQWGKKIFSLVPWCRMHQETLVVKFGLFR